MFAIVTGSFVIIFTCEQVSSEYYFGEYYFGEYLNSYDLGGQDNFRGDHSYTLGTGRRTASPLSRETAQGFPLASAIGRHRKRDES